MKPYISQYKTKTDIGAIISGEYPGASGIRKSMTGTPSCKWYKSKPTKQKASRRAMVGAARAANKREVQKMYSESE